MWFCTALAAVLGLTLFSFTAEAQYGTSSLTNGSGSTLGAGTVVVVDTSADAQFTTTTTADDDGIVGVVFRSIADGSTGLIVVTGYTPHVLVTGTVAVGDYLGTSTTAGRAESNGSTANGSFAIALEANASGTGLIAAVVTPIAGAVSGGGTASDFDLADGVSGIFGTDDDIQMMYDEATDDRFEIHDGTNTLAWLKDNGSTGTFGVTGSLHLLDNQTLLLGTDSDIRLLYDETTDDRAEWTDGTNTLAHLKDAGTTGNFTATGTITSGGNATVTGDLTISGGDINPSGGTVTFGGGVHHSSANANDIIKAIDTTNGVEMKMGAIDAQGVFDTANATAETLFQYNNSTTFQYDSNDVTLAGGVDLVVGGGDISGSDVNDKITFDTTNNHIEFWINGTQVGHIDSTGAYTDDVP